MARILSAALVYEKNKLESDHVWTMAFQLDIQGAPVPFRLVNYDQDIVFHGLNFGRFSVDIDSLEEATTAALVHLRATIGNVDQQLQSLLENYWASSPDPHWEVTIWTIDAMQPNETPFGAGEVFSVTQVQTDFLGVSLDLEAEGLTLSTVVPRRRYTTSSGFTGIPRR